MSTLLAWMFIVLCKPQRAVRMRNTAIFVNKIELKKNDGEISHTTSQHATLDRHDRSIPRDVPRDKGLYPVNIFIPWDNFWFIPLQPYVHYSMRLIGVMSSAAD